MTKDWNDMTAEEKKHSVRRWMKSGKVKPGDLSASKDRVKVPKAAKLKGKMG